VEPHRRNYWLILIIFILIGAAIGGLAYIMHKEENGALSQIITPVAHTIA